MCREEIPLCGAGTLQSSSSHHEMFCNLKTLMIEELVGRLRATEDRFEASTEQVTEKTAKLLLTKEE